MKKVFSGVVFILVIASPSLFSAELLFGTAFVHDVKGNTYDAYDLEDIGFPIIQMVIFDEDEENAKGTLFYSMGYEDLTDDCLVSFPENDSYYSDSESIVVDSQKLGKITITMSGEVLADELWAEIATCQVEVNGDLYIAVGVVAAEEFQQTDEEVEMFKEIVEEGLENHEE